MVNPTGVVLELNPNAETLDKISPELQNAQNIFALSPDSFIYLKSDNEESKIAVSRTPNKDGFSIVLTLNGPAFVRNFNAGLGLGNTKYAATVLGSLGRTPGVLASICEEVSDLHQKALITDPNLLSGLNKSSTIGVGYGAPMEFHFIAEDDTHIELMKDILTESKKQAIIPTLSNSFLERAKPVD